MVYIYLNECNDFFPPFHQFIKDFYNESLTEELNWTLDEKVVTVLYSLTVSIFAIGGMTGALLVARLVTKYGR